jgi:hypothetical protein
MSAPGLSRRALFIPRNEQFLCLQEHEPDSFNICKHIHRKGGIGPAGLGDKR